jgi:Rab11 family-interacting protein 3/4
LQSKQRRSVMARIFESLNDMEPSNGMRLTSSPTSASVASRLYAGGQQRSSRRTSFSSEPDMMNSSDNEIHSEMANLTDELSRISKQMAQMQETQNATNEERSRLRTENALLQQRLVTLEEQQQLSEQRWNEKLKDEQSRSKYAIERYEREKELDSMKNRIKFEEIERENEGLKKKLETTTEEVTKLKRKHQEIQYELELSLSHVEQLEQDRDDIKHEFEAFKQKAQNEIDNSTELVEELTKETDELRRQPRHGSLAEQIVDYEEEIAHLKDENKTLRLQNEELQSQILHDSVERGRVLLQGGLSLADEMNTMDNVELMNALKEQELDNQKLRQYINGILMRVIERHPEILEIKDEELTQDIPNSS